MTFAEYEGSQTLGTPVELFTIAMGASTFRFTSGEDDYLLSGDTYTAITISRSRIQLSAEQRQDAIQVKIPSSNAFAQLFVDLVPSSIATLTMRRVHRDDPDQEAAVFFKGVIQSLAYTDDGKSAEIHVQPLTRGLSRTVPRFTYQGLCNHFLYDSQCQVLQNSFKHTGNVTSITGSTYMVDGLSGNPDGWATGGFVQVAATDFRLVLSHSGDDVTLLLPFPPSVAVGTEVDVFAGCDHTIAICDTKFDKVNNYGGFAFVPLKNIFETGLQ